MARTISNELLELKLTESLTAPVPERTTRDIRLPGIAGKALAVIGVRRGGKTSLMQRIMTDRVAAGEAREQHLLLSLEDERLVGMTAEDLGWLLDEHLRRVATGKAPGSRTVYLDEIQVVAGWASLVRRLLDTGNTRVFLSGSSAKLLSREVGTSLRGRAMEVLVHPFSFRESLRHRGLEPATPWEHLDAGARAALEHALRGYLACGGFPEAQGAEALDRMPLLKGYVDVMVLRDVIDRHDVSNTQALRRLQRHLLTNPAGPFTVNRFYRDLKSQGLSVSKDTLYEYLDHLEDAFLVRLVGMHTASERQRAVNPRKAYPIDTGLIAIYERGGRENVGRALETAVFLELERRGYQAGWVRAGDDAELDFYAERHGDQPLLLQVCLETTSDETWHREIKALTVAAARYPEARAMLLTLDPSPPARPLPEGLAWQSAAGWLLQGS